MKKPIERKYNKELYPHCFDENEIRELEKNLKEAVERIEKSQKLILSLDRYTSGFGSAEVIQDNKVFLKSIEQEESDEKHR